MGKIEDTILWNHRFTEFTNSFDPIVEIKVRYFVACKSVVSGGKPARDAARQ